MVTRQEFKSSLNELEKKERICFLYLEELIDSKMQNMGILIEQKENKPIDLSPIKQKILSFEQKIDSLIREKQELLSSAHSRPYRRTIFIHRRVVS